ncbi:MAG TPA: tRNA uridine-5-carboxymethylaminomethyl(34) synthesis GTPase MnmE [Acidobacteriaceae bacterium]|nr:tRNA uridine-5-carboxymethylaminomethyl(34) synthesis GTPase MnmE [Acidobacteriaceae bacterium]
MRTAGSANWAPDTIAAVATPPGRGGIGIVRLSGPKAWQIAGHLVRLRRELEAGRTGLAQVRDPGAPGGDATGTAIDEAVVTPFAAPHSYTGEDVVEIAAHGSPVVLDTLLRGALSSGARLARPGEFTERAFLNGRLDLTQAEAVHDLIAAQTLEQARMAAQQLGGALSRRVAPIKERLVTLIALLEAGMDFAAGELDDVDVVSPGQIRSTLTAIREPLQRLAQSYAQGHRLREGASLALVGRPNVGKSSLFNRLLERERAIVTPLPGTTRDTVEEVTAVGGVPLRLIDTAGLRLAGESPADEAEALGIERSREALADADLVVVVLDATATLHDQEAELLQSLDGRPHLVVRNKADLVVGGAAGGRGTLTSAVTGQGVEELRSGILSLLQAGGEAVGGGVLNSLRQQEAVGAALESLGAAERANETGVPHEFLLADLHGALRALDSLTGQTTSDDILNRIFSTFCIGK